MGQFPSDLEIARQAKIQPIKDIAAKLGLDEEHLHFYGRHIAKLPLNLIDHEKISRSKLVLVAAINPTPAGEGKTTISVGLADGLNKIGKKTVVALREPSLGPVFGMKGGAAGGGYAQVIPMEDINLHFTGDFAAVEKANNLLAALIDNNLQNDKLRYNLDPRTITWKRVMDMNDRALRHILIGIGGTANGIPREDGFNITPASEVMAILCMSHDMEDLKRRMGNILVGFTFGKKPVYARDLQAQGAMALLMKDAIKPNLVQTLEGNPAIIHGGPFANIAQGTNSIIATRMAMSLSDYVITEAGFGADLGAEKFLHIKCVEAGLKPYTIVLVVTMKALRYHGGAKKDELNSPSVIRVEDGFANLSKHIENCKAFGINPVVAINEFPGDSEEEVYFVRKQCAKMGVQAVVSQAFAKGGEGSVELAETVCRVVEKQDSDFKPLYSRDMPLEDKIRTVATKVYGAADIALASRAKRQLKIIKELGYDNLPVCIAKTQKSLSDDETLRGRPEGFTLQIREFELAIGAGFIIPIVGELMRMPGLPAVPASVYMDIDNDGNISGLS